MGDLQTPEIERYLKAVRGPSARVVSVTVLGKGGQADIKGYGYGTPLLLTYEANGVIGRAVLHTVAPGPFGHEHMSDRAQSLLWEYSAFNTLPRHLKALDVAAFQRDGSTVSLGNADEFFLLTEYAEGRSYAEDLFRMRDTAAFGADDVPRADALCDYLAAIHAVIGPEPGLYVRRIRELVGNSECIFGLVDSYPANQKVVAWKTLQDIEHRCVEWRWRLRGSTHRLKQVHGDFHPWNILFREGSDFTVLDRSRGEWGEPADDVTCLTMNYLFFSLQRSGRLDGNFESLFRRFWDRYLSKSGDLEMLRVAAPFFAFRGLVMAHPVWYPALEQSVRDKLFRFTDAVLNSEEFHPEEVNRYCGA